MIYIIIIVILIVIFAIMKGKKIKNTEVVPTLKPQNDIAIGMYFMDLSESLKKDRNPVLNKKLLIDYYWILGCAAQGRISEVKENIKFIEDTNLESFFKIHKPQILKMAKIAKEVDDKPIGYDLKVGESIGEYFDRKVSKRPAFMKEFEYFKDFDIEAYLLSVQ